MKIAFDAKRITHNKTGLGNYGRYIVNILSQYYPRNTYLLYSPNNGNKELKKQVASNQNIEYRYSQGWLPKAIWRSFQIVSDLRKEEISLYHGLSNELPFGLKRNGIKSVVTIHDLIFIRYPQFYKWIDRKIYSYKFKIACREADRIVAISEMTKKDIIDYFHIPAYKIDVVYQGCDLSFTIQKTKEEKKKIKEKYKLPERYILSVGTIESRKNLLLVVKSLKYLPEDIVIVAIGRKTPYTVTIEKYIEEHGLSTRVRFLHTIPFDELPAFYQMATIFAYPSFFEGFGIPIIESLYSGTPVVAATGSCLEEAGGPKSIYIDPTKEEEMGKAINKILNNRAIASSMIVAGKEYAKRFSEQKISNDIMAVYNKILSQK